MREIVGRLHQVDLRAFKIPWNVHYASYEPERQFSDLLFANADLFDVFVKMPDRGGYAFPTPTSPRRPPRPTSPTKLQPGLLHPRPDA